MEVPCQSYGICIIRPLTFDVMLDKHLPTTQHSFFTFQYL